MQMLWIAAAVWVLMHLLIAGTRIRDGLTAAIGEGVYSGLFSLLSVATLIWLIFAYNHVADNQLLWQPGRGIRDCGILIVGLAFFLGIQGLLTPNPTSVAQGGLAKNPDVVRGVLRITRHPFLWGVALWAAFHLAANGDEASTVFFGSFLVLALLGTASIDAKRARKMGPDWEVFAKQTSNIPFGALLTGRTRLRPAEDFGWRFLVAMLVFAGLLFAHLWLFHVSPFPGGWRPY